MHVGALAIFEGPPPAREEFCAHLEARLGLVPRYRQKLAFPPLDTGRPFWVDDPSFNLDYHVRHTALPKPGSDDQLRQLVGRIFSQRLDRSKPLWETWIVQGLERGSPGPEPSDTELVVDGVKGLIRTPLSLAGRALGALQRPGHTIEQVREAAEGIGEVVWAGLNPAPDVPLNVPIGPHRRVRW